MKILTSLLYLVITLNIQANSPLSIIESDHEIISLAFNHQFAESNNLVDKMISENSDIPKYYFLKIVTKSLENLAESDKMNFEDRHEFRQVKNEELIEFTDGVIERFEDIEMTPENKFYMANLYGYLGRMYGLSRSYMDAFSNANEGKDLLEELVEEFPELYDAYLLLGMFEYYADRLGGVTEFIASILGFSGDRNTGIEYMKLASERGNLTKPLADFILGETFFIQESNQFAAIKYFGSLIENYPQNKSFYDWYVRILLSLGRVKEAGNFLDEGGENNLTGFTKAQFYYDNGELVKAKDLLKQLIDAKDFKWGFAYRYSKFRYAVILLLLGESAADAENELGEFNIDIYNEIKNNLTAAKAIYDFSVAVGRMDDGIQIDLTSKVDLPKQGFLRSNYEFYSGLYFFKTEDYSKAERYFLNIANVREHNRDKAVEYLIEIYKRIEPSEDQIDRLEDIIDELDDDDLEFSFMDLKE